MSSVETWDAPLCKHFAADWVLESSCPCCKSLHCRNRISKKHPELRLQTHPYVNSSANRQSSLKLVLWCWPSDFYLCYVCSAGHLILGGGGPVQWWWSRKSVTTSHTETREVFCDKLSYTETWEVFRHRLMTSSLISQLSFKETRSSIDWNTSFVPLNNMWKYLVRWWFRFLKSHGWVFLKIHFWLDKEYLHSWLSKSCFGAQICF